MKQLLLGNEAIARGAFEAGVKLVSSYPGTPSTEITEAMTQYKTITSEWAPNEKVGAEVAIGAAIYGVRSMTCMKHVGLNVAADPLFTASYTGVNGGLVFVVADDPGMHSSQNEQDSRHYARSAKVPMFEPGDSQECKEYIKKAFEISESYDTPVFVRLQTRVAHSRSLVEIEEPIPVLHKPYVKDMAKNVMMPAMAVKRHVIVENRMGKLALDSDLHPSSIGLHQETIKSTKLGIITAGAAYQYVAQAVPEASILKLGLVWPLPYEIIQAFAQQVETLVVVEELDAFLETEIKALGIPCVGKDLFSLQGEYSVKMIKRALRNPLFLGVEAEEKVDVGIYPDELPSAPNRPPVMCAGCPHKGMFLAFARLKLHVTGDIGCYTLGALPPMSAMDACVCMGASVGMAHGFDKASDGEASKKTVGVIGDSTFLHSGITGLIHAVYNQSNITLVILDNSITGMTGHQQNPTSGFDIYLQPAPVIDLEKLCESLGVSSIRVVDPIDTFACQAILKEELAKDGVSVIIGRKPCALIPSGKGLPENRTVVHKDSCVACGQCMKMMCPALTKGSDNKPVIDWPNCNACGLCMNLCKFDALTKGGKKHER